MKAADKTLGSAVMARAEEAVARCRRLANYSEEPGFTTRTFLSAPMRAVHRDIREWMERAGMRVAIDAAGNIRGVWDGNKEGAPRLVIGSHLDTVPRAGAFDGILGVVLGIALVEEVARRGSKLRIEVAGFSEEEGVRFGVPFIGSRALAGQLDEELLSRRDAAGVSITDAIRAYGLDPAKIPDAKMDARAAGYLEIHIEQGPVLESRELALGVVEAIVGQSRLRVTFEGRANHAGTTPMALRRDALAGAAEWIGAVEREAGATPGLVATVGMVDVAPGAGNVIAGTVHASLDVRHADDEIRHRATDRLLACANQIASRRGLSLRSETRLDQAAVALDPGLTGKLESAVAGAGYPVYRMNSGAGHDAMVLAPKVPSAMLFLRSPGGLSHHPDESVLTEDVAAAIAAGVNFLESYASESREHRRG